MEHQHERSPTLLAVAAIMLMLTACELNQPSTGNECLPQPDASKPCAAADDLKADNVIDTSEYELIEVTGSERKVHHDYQCTYAITYRPNACPVSCFNGSCVGDTCSSTTVEGATRSTTMRTFVDTPSCPERITALSELQAKAQPGSPAYINIASVISPGSREAIPLTEVASVDSEATLETFTTVQCCYDVTKRFIAGIE